MPLRKSPTLTPALLEANRRNAKKSTGPRTARGKAQTRLNALREGEHSRLWQDLVVGLCGAPPCRVEGAVQGMLTPEMARHPLFAEAAEIAIEAESQVRDHFRQLNAFYGEEGKKNSF